MKTLMGGHKMNQAIKKRFFFRMIFILQPKNFEERGRKKRVENNLNK
jgi:hypothetical protein